jgi:glutaredoxin-like protein NrdH
VKEFLSRNGQSFSERLVDEDETAYEELIALGFRAVPLTVIGSRTIVGFDAEALTTALADAD